MFLKSTGQGFLTHGRTHNQRTVGIIAVDAGHNQRDLGTINDSQLGYRPRVPYVSNTKSSSSFRSRAACKRSSRPFSPNVGALPTASTSSSKRLRFFMAIEIHQMCYKNNPEAPIEVRICSGMSYIELTSKR